MIYYPFLGSFVMPLFHKKEIRKMWNFSISHETQKSSTLLSVWRKLFQPFLWDVIATMNIANHGNHLIK